MINRVPINERSAEATYQVSVTAAEDRRDVIRDQLVERLEEANHPIRELEVIDRDEEVEVVATLAATSVEPAELDGVAHDLEKLDGVNHATWTSTSAE
jgi:putative Mg2+ transporter-C (MgtC) family protein